MSGRTAFILNARAGGGFDAGWLETHRAAVDAIAAGGPVTLVSNGAELATAVQHALDSQCTSVVAGGGDGTLNSVASRLVGTKTQFGVLPMGTLNHFARDLGIPTEPEGALKVIAEGHAIDVDVGEVNGAFFLNNSGLGLYPDIVRDRKRQQNRLGRGKWLAFAWAVWGALRRFPFLTARLTLNGESILQRTPFVFVGNNAYEMQGFQIGTRARLDKGVLSIYVAHNPSRLGLVLLGLRALFGRLRQASEFHAYVVREARVDTPRRRLRVSTDGEIQEMAPPFLYRVHAGALRVLVPAKGAGR